MSTSPSKIVCVGRNYAEHAKELGNVIPDRLILFIKPASSLRLSARHFGTRLLGECHLNVKFVCRSHTHLSQETGKKLPEAIVL